MILSSGIGINGREILKIAYKQNKLNYKKYFKIDKKFIRKKEDIILIGNQNNNKILTKRFGFKFSTYGSRLLKKMYKQT
jgi:GDPmannose 4,6-dehydratase